ncbi:MAG: hypothetical protein K2Q13_12200 [Nitrosomonas sp.]|nr:hypothetical protein [Nitrosomonas sp.]MBY0475803.1 hypothetical protein [Nitrosomonas sp.]
MATKVPGLELIPVIRIITVSEDDIENPNIVLTYPYPVRSEIIYAVA